jgi:hypothetical protein
VFKLKELIQVFMKELLVIFISMTEVRKAIVNFNVELFDSLKYFLTGLLLLFIPAYKVQCFSQMQFAILYEINYRNMSLFILQKILALEGYIDLVAIEGLERKRMSKTVF